VGIFVNFGGFLWATNFFRGFLWVLFTIIEEKKKTFLAHFSRRTMFIEDEIMIQIRFSRNELIYY